MRLRNRSRACSSFASILSVRMNRSRLRAVLPYFGAVALVVVAVFFRTALDEHLRNRQPFSAFLVAVLLTSRLFGFRPSLLAIVLSALASRYFFVVPRYTFSSPGSIEMGSLCFFTGINFACALIMRSEQVAKEKLEEEISERKKVEAELRASQKRFHTFVDGGPFAAFMKDESGRYVYVNKYCQENWGLDTAKWLGNSDHDLYHKELADLYVTNDRQALKDGAFVPFEEATLTPDGRTQYWSTTKFPVPDENGRTLLGGIAIEVTEARLATQQAKESQEQLLLALEAGRLGIWCWDVRTNRVRSSETQALITGYSTTHTEASLEESISTIHPDDRHLMQTAIERIFRNDPPTDLTYRVVWPDGSTHWIEAVGRARYDESGTPLQVMGASADITERRLADEALRAAEQRFRGIYEQSPLGIALIDSHSGRFLQINPRYEEIIRRSEEEMVRLTFQEITHPDDLADDLSQMELLRRGEIRRFQMEKRLLRGDGSYMWAGLTVVPMWQPGEPTTCHMAMVSDITERKQIEDQLRMRESQLSGILDNTPAVIYLKDAEGRYRLTNRTYQGLFAHLGESIIGKTDREFFPEPFAEGFLESDARVWHDNVPVYFEETAPHADGPHTYRSIKFPVRDVAGKMIALGGISTDISDLKAAQASLEQEQELLRNLIEVQEKEKQFLCHEFHDGLIQYAVASLMSLEGYQEQHPNTGASEILATVVSNLRRGVEDGRRVIRGIRPAVLDDSGIEAAVEDLIGQFGHSGIMVTSKCDPEIGRLPESIQTTVYRVIQESLSNAWKHSGTDVVRIRINKIDGDLQLEVRDFGCGFDVGPARKRGFGLLGMTERVRLLGGECTIQSELEQGTCVSVRLPLQALGGGEI
ncbi:MAG: hypothetical protein C0483_17240 [Pirellula sp.]|nr:hypothetical protein [Pirellula sp.]